MEDGFCCKWQITDSDLRTRSQEVAWFQNCLIQWYQYQIFPSFPPSLAYRPVHRLVHSQFRHCHSSTSSPNTTTTEGLLVPVSLFITAGNRSQKLPADFPHIIPQWPNCQWARTGQCVFQSLETEQWSHPESDRPAVHLSDSDYRGDAGGQGDITGVLLERRRCLLRAYTDKIDVYEQVLKVNTEQRWGCWEGSFFCFLYTSRYS